LPLQNDRLTPASRAAWLEQNGYDVSYMSAVDADRYGSLLLNHKMYLNVGHDATVVPRAPVDLVAAPERQVDAGVAGRFDVVALPARNGYDVSYMSAVDADRYGSLLLNHKMYLNVGHDEYLGAVDVVLGTCRKATAAGGDRPVVADRVGPPLAMWLEQNGYDVSYMSAVDADRYGSLLLNHKMYLNVVLGTCRKATAAGGDRPVVADRVGPPLALAGGWAVQDGTAGENEIPFIVRDDASRSDIIFQTADTTWQGRCSPGDLPQGHRRGW
jgi:hypothetical protein